MKKIFIILLFITTSILAQNYTADDGTVQSSWRIGNYPYVEVQAIDDTTLQAVINDSTRNIAFKDWVKNYVNTSSGLPVPVNDKFLYYKTPAGLQWKWAWSPDTTTVVRTSRLLNASAPLRIDGTSSADLSSNRTFSLLYNATNLKLTSNTLNTIQNIDQSAMPQFAGATFTGNVIQSGNNSYYNNFISGWAGSGWKLDYGQTTSGASNLEIDNLTVRGTMSVYELLLNQIRATNGNVITSDAAKVESFAGNIIVFEDPSNHNVCPFREKDLLLAQRWDALKSEIRQVRVTVQSVSGRTVTCSSLSDTPEPGDTFVRVGNTNNPDRQGSVYTVTSDSYAPYIDIINGVNSWSAWTSLSKTKARYGNLAGVTDSYFGTLSGYGLYSDNVYLKGNIYMNGGSITWGAVNKPTQSQLGTWATYIDDYGIFTGTVTANHVISGLLTSNNWGSSSGSQLDLSNGTIKLGGSLSPKFSVDANGYMTSTSGRIGGWNITSSYIRDDDPKVELNSTNKSLLIRPTTGTGTGKPKYIAIGQTIGTSFTYTGNYGMSIVDDNGNYLFRVDDAGKSIAGWNFDQTRFYNIPSGSTGFELSNNSSKTITAGFAVWNPSDPKLFIGNSTYSLAWNNDGAHKLEIKGNIYSSLFSTTTTLINDDDYTGSMVIQTGFFTRKFASVGSYYWRGNFTGEELELREESLGGVYTGRGVTIHANGATRFVSIDGYNVPKFWGITNTAPTTNVGEGDYYIGTTGTLGIWTGSQWRYYNLN